MTVNPLDVTSGMLSEWLNALGTCSAPGPGVTRLVYDPAWCQAHRWLAGKARIGITGAPGAGKSTLLDARVRGLRHSGQTVAVVAVDPSSQRTGGVGEGRPVRHR